MYLNAFVRPETGDTFWLIFPTVTTETFQISLTLFCEDQQINADNPAILVLDGAGFHSVKELTIPVGLSLKFLPPYSPELQPAERLWPLSNESVVNKSFPSITELEENQMKRCQYLRTTKDRTKNLCIFHWWPRTLSCSI